MLKMGLWTGLEDWKQILFHPVHLNLLRISGIHHGCMDGWMGDA